MSQTFLSQLHWRHATKHFNPDKKIDQALVDRLVESIKMSPTSHGLQAFHLCVVTDPQVKSAIRAASFNQSQVSQASHLLVLCYRTDLDDRIDQYVELSAKIQGSISEQKMSDTKSRLRRTFVGMTPAQVDHYLIKQVYVVLGFALAACAELGIDSCPMEGFDNVKVDELLQLPSHIKSVLLLPIGYRSKDPDWKKVRFSEADLVTKI